MKQFTVPLRKVMQETGLTPHFLPEDAQDALIKTNDINRPGLQLAGFFENFECNRLQILGLTEIAYLEQLGPEERQLRLDAFLATKPPAVVVTRGIVPGAEMTALAEKHQVPLLSSSDTTSEYMAILISHLNVELAPRITRHGVFVEVYGEGILLTGDSGVGKSETAIELVKRGHRLIADDAVEIRRVSAKTLVGTAPENIRHFVELRGIGIINARRIFGMGAIKVTEKIDMVIQLEIWDSEKVYDRMGLGSETTMLLGIPTRMLTIPVKPGRNLAIIIEVAAMNNRQKKMGYDAANELMHNLGMETEPVPPEKQAEWMSFGE